MNFSEAKLGLNTWVVIAAYNERRRIGAVLDGLLPLTKNIVVVDDGSWDDTAGEVLKRSVWVIRHRMNLGQGAALQTGIDFTLSEQAEYIVTFDADGQHSPADIPVLVQALQKNAADFALGSRFLGDSQGMPFMRRLILRLGRYFTFFLSGIVLSDVHNGIRAMSRKGAKAIHLKQNRMEHASEIIDQIAASKLPYVEVPVHVKYTQASLAKGQKSSDAFKLGLKILLNRMSA